MSFDNNASLNEVLRRIKLALRERELRASAMASDGEVSIAPSRRSPGADVYTPGDGEFADDVFVLDKSMEVGGRVPSYSPSPSPMPSAVAISHAEVPNFSGIDMDDFYRLFSRRVAAFLRASNSALLLEDWLKDNFVSILEEAKG